MKRAAMLNPTPTITLRPANADDLGFAALVYLRAMGDTLQRVVGLDTDRQAALLLAQWDPTEIHIIAVDGCELGWVQVAPASAAVFIRNICIDPEHQRRGIGSVVLRHIIDAADRTGEAVTLGVAKGNPARRLYERLGFRLTHEDAQHDYLRRDKGPVRA